MREETYLGEPVYALKVIRATGHAVQARRFQYGAMLTSKRWRRAPAGPVVLCRNGWHVWPFVAEAGNWPNRWRAMREWVRGRSGRPWWDHDTPEVWLVQVKGEVMYDGSKLAAERLRFVRTLTSVEQRRMPTSLKRGQEGWVAIKIREVLGLPENARLLLDLDRLQAAPIVR